MMRYISKVPTMNKFAFLLDLRRGSMIAALYGILMSSIASPSFVVYLKYFQNSHEHHIYESKNFDKMNSDLIWYIGNS